MPDKIEIKPLFAGMILEFNTVNLLLDYEQTEIILKNLLVKYGFTNFRYMNDIV